MRKFYFLGDAMVVIEIDQSGKWEASGHTAIGASVGGRPWGALVERHEKDRIFRILTGFSQERTKSKKARIARFFAYTVFLTVHSVVRPGDILLIDREYIAQEQTIRDLMTYLFKRFSSTAIDPKNIQFGHVGKTTLAHAVAHQTLDGERKPDIRLRLDDYYRLLDRTVEIREKALRRRKARR